MNKYFLTGGAGYIGCRLTETLLKDEKNIVTVYDNLMYHQDGIMQFCQNPRFNFIYGDVRDKDKLKESIKNQENIIALAGIVGMPACEKEKQLAWDVNAEHIRTITDAKSKEQKLVVPNSNSGYRNSKEGEFLTEKDELSPGSVYGKSKVLGEKYGIEGGAAVARLATVFGTSQKMRRDLLVNDFVFRSQSDKFIVLFESGSKRNYIHILDVCDFIIQACEQYDKFSGESFNVGLSSANLTKKQLAEKIKEYAPDFVIKEDEYAKDFDARDYLISNQKLESMGWTAKRDLDFGIKELIKAYSILRHSQHLTGYTNL